jgi:PAS domain S-box-containing protein
LETDDGLLVSAAVRDISERNRAKVALGRKTMFLQLLQDVTVAANDAATVDEAFQTCLDLVCTLTSWPVGHVYFPKPGSPGELVPTSLWHFEDRDRFKCVRDATEATCLGPGVGLPGRVLASAKPAWVADVTADRSFLKGPNDDKTPIWAAIAFPVLAGKEVVAVVEFFANEVAEPDEALLNVLAHIGTQLGRVIERKHAQERLQRSEMKFRSVAQLANEAIIIADKNGEVVFWNQGAQAIFGQVEADVLGTPLTRFLPERYRAIHSLGLQRLGSPEIIHFLGKTVELHGLRKDGTEFPLELSVTSWQTEGQTFCCGIIRDCTRRKQAEQEILRLNEELQKRVNEMEAANNELEAFSYSVSHDLRAPLRAMDGFSRILLEDHAPQLPIEVRGHLERVRGGAQQMGHLIDDLLSFSRLSRQPLQKQIVDPRDLVQQVLEGLRSEQDGRCLEVSLAELLPCRADPALLRQVFVNLLENAVKYTRRRAKAMIEVGCREDMPGESVYFIKDNGVGFDMRYAHKLFGVFQRLHRAEDYEGTGVGLATVQRIIHRHGGRVWAEAEVDRGATFYFTLERENGRV